MSNSTNPQTETAKDKFLQTVSGDAEQGLVDIKFYRNSNGADSSEDVYQEINAMWASENLKVQGSEKL